VFIVFWVGNFSKGGEKRDNSDRFQTPTVTLLLNKVSRLSKISWGKARLLVKNGASGAATRLLIRAQIRRNYGVLVLRLVQVHNWQQPTIFSEQVGVWNSLVAFIRFISLLFVALKFSQDTQ
jgi:hypothetical protein